MVLNKMWVPQISKHYMAERLVNYFLLFLCSLSVSTNFATHFQLYGVIIN